MRFAVPEGEASITVALSAAVAASAEQYKLSAAADNQHLTLTVNGEVPQLDAGYGITIVDNLTHPVWSSAAHRGNVPLRITLPDSITGGEYCAQLYNAVGDRLAETKFTLAGRAPKAGPVAFTIPSYHSENEQIGAINPVPGVQVKGYGREWGEKMGTANVYPQTAQVILKADEMPAFERGVMSGALNMQLKRYVKIQLSGNYAWFAKEGAFSGDVNVSFRNGEAPSGAALTLDFVDKQGRMSRTFAGVGLIFQTHNSAHPKVYGTAEIPERIATISDFAGGKSGKESEELWIDCYSLGAPADWSGEVWLGLCIHNSSPDRRLELKILESREQLPEGVTAAPIFYLKGAPNEG